MTPRVLGHILEMTRARDVPLWALPWFWGPLRRQSTRAGSFHNLFLTPLGQERDFWPEHKKKNATGCTIEFWVASVLSLSFLALPGAADGNVGNWEGDTPEANPLGANFAEKIGRAKTVTHYCVCQSRHLCVLCQSSLCSILVSRSTRTSARVP